MRHEHVDPLQSSSVSPPGTSPRSSSSTVTAGTRRSLIAEKLYRDFQQDRTHAAAREANVHSTPRTGGGKARSSGGPPRFLICYLCGQQFGTASLSIHQPQCYVKKLLQWEKSKAATRGAKPQSPEEHERALAERGIDTVAAQSDAQAFNELQFQQFTEKALVPCDNCGRTFLPDRLEIHLRSCKPGAAARPVLATKASGSRAVSPPRLSSTARAVEFKRAGAAECGSNDEGAAVGRTSDTNRGAVLPQAEEQQQQQQRRVAPSAARFDKVPSRFREQQAATLVRCQFCNRTFAKDRIEKHEGVCLEGRKPPPPPAPAAAKPRRPVTPRGGATAVSAASHLAQRQAGRAPDGSGAHTAAAAAGEEVSQTPDEFCRRVEEMMARDENSSTRSPLPLTTGRPSQLSTPTPASHQRTPSSSCAAAPAASAVAAEAPATTTTTTAALGPPKFCTECGSKMLSPTQKFCAECGTSVSSMAR